MIHDERYPQDAPDEAWLADAGANGWAVLTKDKRIRHRELEFQTLMTAGVATFVLRSGKLSGPQQGAVLAAALPRMTRWVTIYRPPFIVMVDRDAGLKARTALSRRGGPKP